MKALNFLEWFKEWDNSRSYIDLSCSEYQKQGDALDFYSQKFSIDMIYNQRAFLKDKILYEKYEKKRILDCWEYKGNGAFRYKDLITINFSDVAISAYYANDYEIDIANLHEDYTLNDFITDWNNFIKSLIRESNQQEYFLQWNKQNEETKVLELIKEW